jgi:leader peptidase (prepilin peptidase)/N-methyltransferase
VITLVASDFEERILPDEFTKGGIVLGLIFAWFVPMGFEFAHLLLPMRWGPHWISVSEAAIGAAVTSGSIWLVGFLYEKFRHREGLGFGDVKMIAMIGAFLGLKWALMTLISASMIGAVGGLLFAWISRKDIATYELPFGSFLGVASLGIALYAEVFLKRLA